jgi:glycine dehydrogenase subunit 1
MRYLPHTEEEIQQMLGAIGVESIDALFESVPAAARFQGSLAVPAAMDEPSLMAHLKALALQNTGAELLSFLGAGIYAHHIPPAVDQLLLRSEFYTSYTPYQPEVAQGTLQAIWEFQTLVSELYALPLANASMYDGATAAAEAAQMARRLTKRSRVIVSGCVHPQYRQVIRTFLSNQPNCELVEIPADGSGVHDLDAISRSLGSDVACCVVGYPAFQGGLIDLAPLAQRLQAQGALLVSSTTEPYALALAKAPGEMGVDIATGEGQALACPPSFGGPGVGLFACRQERNTLQQIPGRICGETVDKDGQRGFVLTLSTREQHIRRERATSNICTNQGLLALSFTIRMSMLGKQGFIETAKRCMSLAQYAERQICALPGFSRVSERPFFNEFAVKVANKPVAALLQAASERGVIAGLDVGAVEPSAAGHLLIAVTEKHTRQDLDRLCSVLSEVG